jgi:pyruvate dehydrogenase E2 component (dihydrolipoamide acetyltransferase)
MSTEICLPRVSPDDAAVTLVKWHVAVGSRIQSGDVIAEIESDKAVVELQAEEAGVVIEIRVPEGSDDVRAEQVLALIDETAQAPAETLESNPGLDSKSDSDSDSKSDSKSDSVGASLLANSASVSAEDSRASSLLQGTAPRSAEPDGGNGASPLAARMARQAGITLEHISGTGQDGRILADDVRAALGPRPAALSTQQAPPTYIDGDTDLHGGFEPEFDLQTPDNMRRVIAERLVKSKREAPHFYMSLDCRVDALLDLKQSLSDSGARVSLNDLIVKITATTLVRVPALNTAWSDAGIRRFRSVDLAVAVAIEGGLITPVIRSAESKRLSQIAEEMRDLVSRARAGQLSREEYQGGTFTLSNMGMYGVSHFTAVINPPQAAILAVGAASERALAENGVVSTAHMMSCTLSVDHRVSDGVAAAEFLQVFKRLVEDPRLLLI